jgi:3-deoxy-7-phosphoheptulonate synthase
MRQRNAMRPPRCAGRAFCGNILFSRRFRLKGLPVPASTTHRPPSASSATGAGAYPIDDTRIADITELAPPSHLLREFPCTARPSATVYEARHAIHRVLHGADDRLLVVVGPCSIHDYDAAIDYATRLATLRHELADRLIVVMRVYFEKPRTTVGWKGLINDPRLDDSFRINEGPPPRAAHPARDQRARPACRQRVSRHDHAAVHRGPHRVGRDRCANDGEPGPSPARVGLVLSRGLQERHQRRHQDRGGRDQGGVGAASLPLRDEGRPFAIVHTSGNEDCHIILRGGKTTNYDAASVDAVCKELANNGLPARVMIDCSHANSQKQHERQVDVARDIAGQLAAGDARIFGVMVESHINPGRQDLVQGQPLQYGVSITDGCIGWDATSEVLHTLADAVVQRRLKLADEA